MEMIPISSSAIEAAGYDSISRVMVIVFTSGENYTFCGVPRSIFEGLVSAGSAGTYFNSMIRGRYQC